MHTDARTLDDGSLIEGDICIIGAGAAGISMALDWIGSNQRVILLEGGGFEIEAELQDLYHGESIGQRYYPLQSSRLHYFGGTTGHWAGYCATLDPIDFEERPWVPHSGWPIARADLDPFYARAHTILELGPYEYDAAYWEERDPEAGRLPFDESKVWTKMWQFSPPTRFGTRYREDILRAENIHLYTYANVCSIEANESVSSVDELRVRCLNGKEHRVRARTYVMASGAIQNARLLLASTSRMPAGLGNQHDLVGRFFMEHLEVRSAYFVMPFAAPMKMYSITFFETKARGELAVSAEEQEAHRILNCTTSLAPRPETDGQPAMIDWFSDDATAMVQFWDEMEKAYKSRQLRKDEPAQYSEFTMQARLEQAPNPNSRILLDTERDALDMPRVKMDWQLTDLDKRSIKKTHELIGEEAGRVGVGRVKLMDWLLTDEPMWPSILGGGWHHMGTTRMHEDPRHGVVDADCKVHGLANLFVAGSAVFPTAGAANPTLSLVAVTLRLSDHLKEIMK